MRVVNGVSFSPSFESAALAHFFFNINAQFGSVPDGHP
jgi:hypothetical protein